MTKLICFFNLRQHYKNRLKLRGGKHFLFLFAKVVDEKQRFDGSTKCLVWKYKNFIYLTQNWQMQTFINKDIPKL